jgi:Tol biopolymer transport system component
VSKRELLDAVWPDAFVTEDSLVQCLVEIRRALGSDAVLVRTVPRRGYLFDAPVATEHFDASSAVIDDRADMPAPAAPEDGDAAVPGSLPSGGGNTRPAVLDATSNQMSARPGRLTDAPDAVIGKPRHSARAATLLWVAMGAGALALVLAAGEAMWNGAPSVNALPAHWEWEAVTNFPDWVSQPALSPDGRFITFVRGHGTFLTPGQIYIKMLPDGEPRQLTHDNDLKMSPVFSPDGSRIVYSTVVEGEANWHSWSVPVLGGYPRLWLRNASGLAWLDSRTLVFSEIIGTLHGNHMKLVVADERRTASRDLYVPEPNGAMAHRSYPSPDGRWVLAAEMNDRGVWQPCRLIPSDGSSSGRQVGPRDAACRSAAWSPDGQWMYLSSDAGGAYHIWRQRLVANGPLPAPEQLTSGPTDEEGIAMAPDGRSFITALGLQQSAVWLHDAQGERQISLEGYAYMPRFTPDGRHLLYLVSKTAAADTSELWMASLDSGRNEPLLSDLPIVARSAGRTGLRFGLMYDVSPDGRQVAVELRDQNGRHRVWLARLDGRSAPRQVVDLEADTPRFGGGGQILFRASEGPYGFVYAINDDGTGLTKLIEQPAIAIRGVSPDGRWVVAYLRPTENDASRTVAFSLDGGHPVQIYRGSIPLTWSPDGKYLSLWIPSSDKTYVIPLPPGQSLPEIPAGGFASEADIAALAGVRTLDSDHVGVALGPTPDIYAFSRETTQRNLYRIPTP